MIGIGIDIGSTAAKAAVVDGGGVGGVDVRATNRVLLGRCGRASAL